ncbi:hypothetical protein BX600DRAFT_518055 [Xylariales sp. PMI_506]|nr:hypothetical protein BX600DRAFT_518055 [Xylariales sp. PMI_506]
MAQSDGGQSNPVGGSLRNGSLPSGVPGAPLQYSQTFLLSNEGGLMMKNIPDDFLDPSRQKRPHQKSRRGCINCRKRRVKVSKILVARMSYHILAMLHPGFIVDQPDANHKKCDEKSPRCSHCTRREEQCRWRSCTQHEGPSVAVAMSDPRRTEHCQRNPPTASVVNMLHMRLFHHFETYTRHSLAFGSVWKEAMKISLRSESLMHAILCLSARHLAVLQPDDPQHDMAAAMHLSQTLQLFQQDLTKTVTKSNVDSHLATATLLSYILWNELDIVLAVKDSSMNVATLEDRLFRIGGGTLELFLSATFSVLQHHSLFFPHIVQRPRMTLCYVAGVTTQAIDMYQAFFDHERPLTADRLCLPNYFESWKGDNVEKGDLAAQFHQPTTLDGPQSLDTTEAHRRLVARLCVILSFLPEMRRPGHEKAYKEALPNLARYIFSFPILCFRESETLTRRRDTKWWLILYHFYRAVRLELPGEFWWAQQRSRLMEPLLKDLILGLCNSR